VKRGLLIRLERLEQLELMRKRRKLQFRLRMEETTREFAAAAQKRKEAMFSPDELNQMRLAREYYGRAWSPIIETPRQHAEAGWAYSALAREKKKMCIYAAAAELTQWVVDRFSNKDLHARYVRAVEFEMLHIVEQRIGTEVFLEKLPDDERSYYLNPEGTKILWRRVKHVSANPAAT
jgi:hypothetical protein